MLTAGSTPKEAEYYWAEFCRVRQLSADTDNDAVAAGILCVCVFEIEM